jgi:hypothetical protein
MAENFVAKTLDTLLEVSRLSLRFHLVLLKSSSLSLPMRKSGGKTRKAAPTLKTQFDVPKLRYNQEWKF